MHLDKKFEGLVKGLVSTAKKVAEAARKQTDPRPWSNFTDDEFPSEQRPESKKETELKDKTFNRDKIEEDFVEKRGSDQEAKAKEVSVPKIQGDYMAAYERDKRLQWRSRIRNFAHMFGRVAGSGQDNGPLMKNTTDFLSRVFMKAKQKQES